MLLYHRLCLNLNMKYNGMLAIFQHSANEEMMVGIVSVYEINFDCHEFVNSVAQGVFVFQSKYLCMHC